MNRGAGVVNGCVGYEGGSGGAASPIEAKRKSRYGANAGKEVFKIVFCEIIMEVVDAEFGSGVY